MTQFPIVHANGSHFEVGQAIGKQLKTHIIRLHKSNRIHYGAKFLNYLEQSKPYQYITQKYFPEYMDEMRGIAQAADVPFDEYFLANNLEVANVDAIAHANFHCTIVGIPYKEGYILGHNEDAFAYAPADLYILDATISGTRIFGISYIDGIIGSSIATNGFGLTQAINELHNPEKHEGVPRNFIARAVLDCKTLEDVEKLTHSIPRASGYNHVLTYGNRLWNIESTASNVEIEKVTQQKYVHTNHYITRLKSLAPPVPPDDETITRYNKVKQLLPFIETQEHIKQLLSNRNEPPICRINTIGSAIVDNTTKTVAIAYGQPTPDMYNTYQLEENT